MTDISRIRNVAFAGSHHSGKTTLVEAVLAHSGAIGRRGSVLDGSTVTDHEPECINHAQSTSVGFAHATCDGIDISIVDCPGFIDFFEETKAALAGVDAVVVTIDADPTRVVHTQALVDYLESRRMPHLFVINKMERPGADFAGTVAALRHAYGQHVVPEQLPIGFADSFSGCVDLATMQAFTWSGGAEKSVEIPEAMRASVETARTTLLEAMADFDDALMEELLDGREPPLEEVEHDLCAECSHDQIVPVLVASGVGGAGVPALVRAIERWFPSPLDAPQVDAEGREIDANPAGPLIARIIKTTIHPQSGKLSIVRVISGTIKSDATMTNISRGGEKVRSGGLYRMQGKKQEALTSAGPGEIVAIARLEAAGTGDTLTDGHKVLLPSVPHGHAVFAVGVRPKDRIDEAKISQMLARIVDEDPSLRLERAAITNELLLLGSGEQHVTIAVERLARKYKVEVETHPPAIPYTETITGGTEVHARYKHQTGGHGQFADVRLRFAPRDRGAGVHFEEKIVGGVVPRQFFAAVERGVRDALLHGNVGGYPVTDVHVTLFDGAYHDVDSSEQAFKTAAGMAVRDALPKCGAVVLEPIARVRVIVPIAFTSSVISQLTGKRGQILGMNPDDRAGYDVIEADVPNVELSRYITELRTATQGLGTYSWQHERYDPVPGNRIPSKVS